MEKILNNNIRFNNLSSILNSSGNQSAEALEMLINTITDQKIIPKIKQAKEVGFQINNLSSMLHGSGSHAAKSLEKLINTITDEKMIPKIKQAKEVGFQIHNLSSMLYSSGNQSAEALEMLINTITDEKMIPKIKQAKEVGFQIHNLSSMLYSSGNQSAEALEMLINTITDEKMIPKIKQAKEVGFQIHNLSSMLSTCRNQSTEGLEKLINTITDEKIIPKIKQAKEVGFQIENLSSILSGSGNKANQAFQKLINTITDEKVIDKLKTIKALGIEPENLSLILTKDGNTADESFSKLIDLLTNEKYIDTIEKVRTAIYTKSDVINKDDEILVSSRASSVLNDIGDLRKNRSISDPSNNPKFKQFLRACYNKHKHVDDSLLEIKKVDDQDPRVALRGQDKVVAKKKIDKGSILGIYTGILLCDEDPIDNAIELAYLATKNIYGLNKLNSYSFAVNINGYRPLYLSASGRGNILMKINANHTYDNRNKQNKWTKPNVAPSLSSCDGKTPFILFYTTQDITPHTELLFDYGKQYWHNHDNNNDLSNPDAKIYKNLLATKKHLLYSESIRLLKLIKEYDKELYKNILKHIAPPINDFQAKDRVVECRKINSGNTKKIEYRIYKLPGEESIGEKSKDYFEVEFSQLEKYNWRNVKSINHP